MKTQYLSVNLLTAVEIQWTLIDLDTGYSGRTRLNRDKLNKFGSKLVLAQLKIHIY